MKKLTLFTTIIVLSLSVYAAGTKPKYSSPRVYLIMKKGKLIEVDHGKRKLVKSDVTLVNQTTIHPNGSIDASSGESLQLKEGEYITMDGRIRRLNAMYHPPKPRKKVVKKKPAAPKCTCVDKRSTDNKNVEKAKRDTTRSAL